ncbi:MAG: hypothetical protein WBW78_06930 [Terrimicrobiaceae bacterium]
MKTLTTLITAGLLTAASLGAQDTGEEILNELRKQTQRRPTVQRNDDMHEGFAIADRMTRVTTGWHDPADATLRN